MSGRWIFVRLSVRNKTSRNRRARCGVFMVVVGVSIFSLVASSLLVNNDDSWHNFASPKRRLLQFLFVVIWYWALQSWLLHALL